MKAVGEGGYWRLGMRLGAGVGVWECLWGRVSAVGRGEGGSPPPLQAIPCIGGTGHSALVPAAAHQTTSATEDVLLSRAGPRGRAELEVGRRQLGQVRGRSEGHPVCGAQGACAFDTARLGKRATVAVTRGGGALERRRGGEVWTPKVCVPKLARINIHFCKFYHFPL